MAAMKVEGGREGEDKASARGERERQAKGQPGENKMKRQSEQNATIIQTKQNM